MQKYFTTADTLPDTFCTLYPWQQVHWQRFQQQVAQKKRPHALLLSGQKGTGKWDFAKSLAYSVLCVDSRDGFPCGCCRGCQLNKANTHPDLLIIAPEQQGRLIKIDQVRQLEDLVSKTSQQGATKVVLMGPVEALNVHAANALLKILEEPAGDTLLLLTTNLLNVVMATIRSRCQLMPMKSPDRGQALAWFKTLLLGDDSFNDESFNRAQRLLTLTAGAPLTAKAIANGDYLHQVDLLIEGLEQVQQEGASIKVAARWLDIELADILEWWLQIVCLLIKRHFVEGDANNQISDDDLLNNLYVFGERYPLAWLFRFSDKLSQLKQQFFTGANFNKQLLLEELLLDWQVLGSNK